LIVSRSGFHRLEKFPENHQGLKIGPCFWNAKAHRAPPLSSRLIFVGHLWTFQWKRGIFLGMSKGRNTEAQKSEVLQGTLDLMVLKVLDALGPQHGYGIARRIEQVSEQVLQLNEGTVYTSLLRLQQRGWIASDWGTSENNRKAKYYSITKSGRKQLSRETENWERIAGVIGRLLRLEG
jgi:PadR family transcriptional regulator